MPHPDHHATALMLLRAAHDGKLSDETLANWLAFHTTKGFGYHPKHILAMAAAVEAREKAMREAAQALLNNIYICNVQDKLNPALLDSLSKVLTGAPS